MRAVRSVLKKFILPVACFACAAWFAGFLLSYAVMKHHNAGTLVLFAFGGTVLLLPWFVIALAILDRMRGGAPTSHAPDDPAQDLDGTPGPGGNAASG